MDTVPIFDKQEILEQMDKCAKRFNFPVLDNIYWRLGKVRLTAFYGEAEQEWLITFEILAFDVRLAAFVNILYAYGNKIPDPGFITSAEIFHETLEQPFEDEGGNVMVNLKDFRVVIDGQMYHFSPTEESYAQAGISLSDSVEVEAKLLRLLCHLYPSKFFRDNSQILGILKRSPLKQLLKLNEWSHPDISGNELPSENPCFQKLAEALATIDAKKYLCSSHLFNTAWLHWLTPTFK